ncbi:hypothetical protein Tco_0580654 [Tanacetum coccineum]
MKSINHHHTKLLPTQKLNWFSTPSGISPRHSNIYLPLNHVRTMSMGVASSSMVVLAVNSPATTGDLSVLIPTSAAFLLLYYIANFVVPEILMKDLEADDATRDQNPNEDTNMPLSKTINSEPKKKGFQGTK